MNHLCQNLRLSIELEDQQIQITLADDLAMELVSVCYEINQGPPHNRQDQYYLGEAVVIAMRRLMVKAFEAQMICLNLHGQSTSSKVGTLDFPDNLSTTSTTLEES
jgi:DhnA family fructose-bisphosphate aldolase class Ia